MGFHMTCSTDMDSRVTCSKKYVELHVLHGFAIDSHMFAWVNSLHATGTFMCPRNAPALRKGHIYVPSDLVRNIGCAGMKLG